MGYSSDYLPHVGQVPGKPGQYIIAGFTGHGMPQVYLSAKAISKMVIRKVVFEESGVPKLFNTSQERLNSQRNKILDTFAQAQDDSNTGAGKRMKKSTHSHDLARANL
jgi:Glycine/D-amino acid oxidases (deaminating)